MINLSYEYNGRNCPVQLQETLDLSAAELSGRRVVLVSDATVFALHGAGVKAMLQKYGAQVRFLIFPAGEKSKSLATWQRFLRQLSAWQCDRRTLIVALGGGVTTDLAGFTAACYLRGLPLWLIPTSLLAMVDAAIGAKNGVDTAYGKNLVGAFYPPEKTIINSGFLATLPAAEYRCGAAELIKTAYILDAEFFEQLAVKNELAALGDLPLLARAVALKCQVVSGDNLDHGRRQLLNFGHTVGHAIEKAAAISHGEAVALGMLAAGRIALARKLLNVSDFQRLEEILAKFSLPCKAPVTFAKAKKYLLQDKKRAAGLLQMVLPAAIGRAAQNGELVTFPVTLNEVAEAW